MLNTISENPLASDTIRRSSQIVWLVISLLRRLLLSYYSAKEGSESKVILELGAHKCRFCFCCRVDWGLE